MEKLKYWLRNVLGKNDNYCRRFCLNCKYYEFCRADKSDEKD